MDHVEVERGAAAEVAASAVRAGRADRPRPASASTGTLRAGTAALTALAAVLGLAGIGRHSLWLDETVSVLLARMPWSDFVELATGREANMSLHGLLLRGWSAAGDSDAWLRSLATLAAVAAVPLLVSMVARLTSPRTALAAGAVLVVNGLFVQYAQQARGYSLFLLLVVAASWQFARAVEEPSAGRWVAYGVLVGVSAYSHYYALYAPAAHLASLVFLPPGKVPWRGLALAAVPAAVLAAPIATFLGGGQSAGVSGLEHNAAGRLVHDLRDLVPRPVGAALLAVAVAASVVVVGRLRRDGRFGRVEQWRGAYLVALAVVPLALIGLVSYFVKPLITLRYLMVCLPGLAATAALVVTRLRPRLGAAALALLLLVGAATVARWYAGGEEEDWRAARAYLDAEARPGDGVVIHKPFARIPFEHHLDPRTAALLDPVQPAAPWFDRTQRFIHPVELTEGSVAAQARGHDRLWLVRSQVEVYGVDDPQWQAILRALERDFVEVDTESFTGITVAAYTRR